MSLSVGTHLDAEFKSVRSVALAELKPVYSIHDDSQNRFRGQLKMLNNFLVTGPAVAISESSRLFPGIEVVPIGAACREVRAFNRAAPELHTQQR